MNRDASATPDFYFNPFDPEFRADPYPHYCALRQGPPRRVHFIFPAALIARYADCVEVLHDHQRFSSVQPKLPPEMRRLDDDDPFRDVPNMLFSDPPVHTRLRRLVSRDFTPRRIREMEPRIREITRQLLENAARRGEFNAIEDLATPLPVMVIAEILGVPPEQYQVFKEWSDVVVTADNAPPGMPLPPEIQKARRAIADYFSAEIEKRKRNPGPDLVSALVAAHRDAEALSAEELLTFVSLLLLAGNETTTNLIGNGMLALGRHPAQIDLLRRERSLMPRAIEEMLRYDGPVQATVRAAKADANIGGTDVSAGDFLVMMLAAANRDPARFPEPDRFDITREAIDHLAFGEGIHFCIGAPLARMEGQIAIESALEKFPRLRLLEPDAKRTYKGSFFLRGLSSLPMAID